MFHYLQAGDQIGIFSPSSPGTVRAPLRFERGKQFLKSKGLTVIEGNLTGENDTYRSGTAKARAAELNELICNPDIKVIMSTIGGTNSNSMLPYIDYEALKANPKIVVGYSDVTAILLGLYAMTGVPTFYGPALISSFGEFEPLVLDTYDYFERFFMMPQQLPYDVPMPSFWSDEKVNWETKITEKALYQNEWICASSGFAEGKLIGGNLNAMYGILGSPYMPDIQEGDILLIEDCSKTIATIEKNFAMLKVNGIFDKIGGIILGKHEQFDDLGTARKPYEVLLEILDGASIPVLAAFDTCHTHPMHPMPIGRKVALDATNKHVYLMEKWL
ncbi:S66 peptidase family protein [Lentibacillus sp. N15]|uniref:S66 family peptidase n=1 Tax=Lentibacillus songyuanensis TaxID=3136161 RepID=UPI0031BAFFE6